MESTAGTVSPRSRGAARRASPTPFDEAHRWATVAILAVGAVAAAVDLWGTTFVFIDSGDMAFYLDQSELPLTSFALWRRFPLYPLLIDLLGHGKALHAVHVLASTAGICWLAIELMVTVRHRIWGVVLALWALLLWRSGGVQFYHHLAVTEAVSLGLMMAMIAAALHLMRRPDPAVRVLLIVTMVLWAIVRPSNFTVLLLGGAVLLVVWWVRGRRGSTTPRDVPLLGSIMVALGVVVPALAFGLQPQSFYNIIPEWIVPDPEALAWWEDQGMPVPPELLASEGQVLDRSQVEDGPLAEWNEWVVDNASSTYARWVVTHPGWSVDLYLDALGESFTFAEQERNAAIDDLASSQDGRIAPGRTLGDAVFPTSGPLLVLWIVAVGALTAVLVRGGVALSTPAWLGVALALSVPPLLVPVAFGDSQELGRHALGLSLQLRFGLLLVTGWAVDAVLTARRRPAPTAAPTTA